MELELTRVSGGGAPHCPPSGKQKGNNGFGNGGNDPAPGRSGGTGADKAADLVR
jgi:hypothetical protein